MQQICDQPVIILDGAHTVQSLRHLLNSFQQLHAGSSNTVIYGALEDKDHVHMSNLLIPLFDRIIISKPGTFKKSDPDGLSLLFKDQVAQAGKPHLYLEKDPLKALQLALDTTPSGSAILCTGSFYLAGEIARPMRNWNKQEMKRWWWDVLNWREIGLILSELPLAGSSIQKNTSDWLSCVGARTVPCKIWTLELYVEVGTNKSRLHS